MKKICEFILYRGFNDREHEDKTASCECVHAQRKMLNGTRKILKGRSFDCRGYYGESLDPKHFHAQSGIQ